MTLITLTINDETHQVVPKVATPEMMRASGFVATADSASTTGLEVYAASHDAAQIIRELMAEIARLREQAASAVPVAWMDDFGNAFPLGACKGAGSWRDADKRNWRSLYLRPAPAAAPDEDVVLRALVRAERKLSAYVGVCAGDKELTDTVLPMVRAAMLKMNTTKE